jgi:hypothetical protein
MVHSLFEFIEFRSVQLKRRGISTRAKPITYGWCEILLFGSSLGVLPIQVQRNFQKVQ